MPVEVLIRHVIKLPLSGTLCATICCKNCGHNKAFYDPTPDEELTTLADKAYCSKCHSKDAVLEIFKKSTSTPRSDTQNSSKKCAVCNQEIAEHTIEAVPHTICCSLHLDQNPIAKVKVVEPVGSREDFKKDSASNWSRATKPK